MKDTQYSYVALADSVVLWLGVDSGSSSKSIGTIGTNACQYSQSQAAATGNAYIPGPGG